MLTPASLSALGTAATGPIPINSGATPADREAAETGHRFKSQPLRLLLAHHQNGRGAVAGLAAVASSDGPLRVEDRPQPGQRLDR